MARGRPQAHRLGMGLQVGQASLGLQGLRLTLATMPDFLHHFQPEPEPETSWSQMPKEPPIGVLAPGSGLQPERGAA